MKSARPRLAVLVAAFAAYAVLALSACGAGEPGAAARRTPSQAASPSTSPTPSPTRSPRLTKAEFVTAADRVCARVSAVAAELMQRMAALPERLSEKDARTVVNAFGGLAAGLYLGLSDLSEPNDDVQVLKQDFFRPLGLYTDYLKWRVEERFGLQDQPAPWRADNLADIAEARAEFTTFARNYGMSECTKIDLTLPFDRRG